jgi:hypothetical protein
LFTVMTEYYINIEEFAYKVDVFVLILGPLYIRGEGGTGIFTLHDQIISSRLCDVSSRATLVVAIATNRTFCSCLS